MQVSVSVKLVRFEGLYCNKKDDCVFSSEINVGRNHQTPFRCSGGRLEKDLGVSAASFVLQPNTQSQDVNHNTEREATNRQKTDVRQRAGLVGMTHTSEPLGDLEEQEINCSSLFIHKIRIYMMEISISHLEFYLCIIPMVILMVIFFDPIQF